MVLRPNEEKVDRKFLYYSLRRDVFFDYIMNEAGTRGLKMPRGNKDGIIQYKIALPDMNEQRRIATEIEHFESQISHLKEKMSRCISQKQEVVNRYLK